MRIVLTHNGQQSVLEKGMLFKDGVDKLTDLLMEYIKGVPNKPSISFSNHYNSIFVHDGDVLVSKYELAREYEYPKTIQEVMNNEWIQIDKSTFSEQLVGVPQHRMFTFAFLLPEKLCHLQTGQDVFMCFAEFENQYFCKPLIFEMFDPELIRQELQTF